MNMESSGFAVWPLDWLAGRSMFLNDSTISAVAGSYKSAVWPYLAAGLDKLSISTQSPAELASVWAKFYAAAYDY